MLGLDLAQTEAAIWAGEVFHGALLILLPLRHAPHLGIQLQMTPTAILAAWEDKHYVWDSTPEGEGSLTRFSGSGSDEDEALVATDVPLDQPLYRASFAEAVRRFWVKYAVFSGRAGRAEYWWWTLAAAVVALVLEVVRFFLVGGSLAAYLASPLYSLRWTSAPSLLWFIATFVPDQALGVRRLHDCGRTGWWQLLTVLVIAGGIVPSHFLPKTVSLTVPPPTLTGASLVVSTLTSVVTLVVEVVLIIFYTAAPVPAGQRFDRTRPV